MSLCKNKIILHQGCVVCKDCEIEGEVQIGSHTVVHPKARIIAKGGPIKIGDYNLIEEQALIINDYCPEGGDAKSEMCLGNFNVFEIGCSVHSLKIGDYNVVESKAKVGRNTELTSGCVIGAKCVVCTNETVPENTVIFGSDCQRRLQMEKPPPQTLQLDFLKKILPNYHYLKKSRADEEKQ